VIGELTPAQASSLSLLLRHGQSYGDVGRRLGIDPMSVRDRAHEAVALLVGEGPLTGADRLLLDRVLGQVTTVGAGADLARLDERDDAPQLEFLMEALEPFRGPRVSRVEPTPVAAVVDGPPVVEVVEAPPETEVVEVPPLAELAPPVSRRQLSSVSSSAIVRTSRARPRARRSQRRAVSARMGAMLSLGLGFLAAGGVLFINGAH
jgi:hypothetical protein